MNIILIVEQMQCSESQSGSIVVTFSAASCVKHELNENTTLKVYVNS